MYRPLSTFDLPLDTLLTAPTTTTTTTTGTSEIMLDAMSDEEELALPVVSAVPLRSSSIPDPYPHYHPQPYGLDPTDLLNKIPRPSSFLSSSFPFEPQAPFVGVQPLPQPVLPSSSSSSSSTTTTHTSNAGNHPTTAVNDLADIAALMFVFLWYIRPAFSPLSFANGGSTPVHALAKSTVKPSFRKFCRNVLSSTGMSKSAVFVALKYLDRLKNGVTDLTTLLDVGHECLFSALLMLADAWVNDATFTIASWSQVTGISAKRLVQLKSQLLEALDFNVSVSSSEYDEWRHSIETEIRTRTHKAAHLTRTQTLGLARKGAAPVASMSASLPTPTSSLSLPNHRCGSGGCNGAHVIRATHPHPLHHHQHHHHHPPPQSCKPRTRIHRRTLSNLATPTLGSSLTASAMMMTTTFADLSLGLVKPSDDYYPTPYDTPLPHLPTAGPVDVPMTKASMMGMSEYEIDVPSYPSMSKDPTHPPAPRAQSNKPPFQCSTTTTTARSHRRTASQLEQLQHHFPHTSSSFFHPHVHPSSRPARTTLEDPSTIYTQSPLPISTTTMRCPNAVAASSSSFSATPRFYYDPISYPFHFSPDFHALPPSLPFPSSSSSYPPPLPHPTSMVPSLVSKDRYYQLAV